MSEVALTENFLSLTELFFLAATEKSEGRPSL